MSESARDPENYVAANALVPCFVCGKELERVVADNPMQPYGGVICSTHGNFGSKLMDSMFPEDDVRFIVCDDCMIERQDRIRTIVVERVKPTVSYKPWKRVPEVVDAD